MRAKLTFTDGETTIYAALSGKVDAGPHRAGFPGRQVSREFRPLDPRRSKRKCEAAGARPILIVVTVHLVDSTGGVRRLSRSTVLSMNTRRLRQRIAPDCRVRAKSPLAVARVAILAGGLVLVGLTDAQSPAPRRCGRAASPDVFANERNPKVQPLEVVEPDALQSEDFQLSPTQLLRLIGPGYSGCGRARHGVQFGYGSDRGARLQSHPQRHHPARCDRRLGILN